jgi:hypothetical protein
MFHGTVAIHNTVDWDCSDVAEDRRMLAERLTESLAHCGQSIKRSLSDHEPASMDCAVISSNDVTDDLHHGEPMMGVPIRGYVATSTRVHRKAWEESNTLCDVFVTPLTWTKITGGICKKSSADCSQVMRIVRGKFGATTRSVRTDGGDRGPEDSA